MFRYRWIKNLLKLFKILILFIKKNWRLLKQLQNEWKKEREERENIDETQKQMLKQEEDLLVKYKELKKDNNKKLI